MIGGEAAAAVLVEYGVKAMFVARAGDVRITCEWQDAVRLTA